MRSDKRSSVDPPEEPAACSVRSLRLLRMRAMRWSSSVTGAGAGAATLAFALAFGLALTFALTLAFEALRAAGFLRLEAAMFPPESEGQRTMLACGREPPSPDA